MRQFNFHILCEKPLSTNLESCLRIKEAVEVSVNDSPEKKEIIFGIGHVLRYSPHNQLLRKLVRLDKVIGNVVTIDHTEPVGWWHFAHSYVR